MTPAQITEIPTGIAYDPPAALPASGVQWPVDPARTVLLVHDMQDHFVQKYRRDAEPISSVIDAIRRLVDTARPAGVPVVFSAQPGDQDPAQRGLLSDFWGAGPRTAATGFIPDIGEVWDQEYMRKWRYSAFQRTDLHQRLADAGRDTLLITGIYANIGIKATALEAFMADIRAVVVGDGVADFDADQHRSALEWIAARCGAVTGLQEVLAAWNAGSGVADSFEVARTETAEVLGLEPRLLDAQTDLLDAGLDSVRAMELADRLAMAGVEVPFERLIASRTMDQWGLG